MASVSITAPANNAVLPKNQNANVTWTTDRPDLDYEIELIDAATGKVIKTVPVAATGSSPMSGTIPGANLPANGSFQIRVRVAPAQGTGSSTVDVTTGP